MALVHLWSDLHDGWAALTLARPQWQVLLLLLPLMAALDFWHRHRRRLALLHVGRPEMLQALRTRPVWGQRFSRLAYPLAWGLLILGMAGPRWGANEEGGAAIGRDVVLVLDVSRSMLANDMSGPATARIEAAKAAAQEWLDRLAHRGGHRIALVVFAARPVVLCPLTTDYDHLRAVLGEFEGTQPPLGVRPGRDGSDVSGTRLGDAISAAVELHDPQFVGAQSILLLSDGDDPVNDLEWRRGVAAARAARIPVDTVGLGNPNADSPIIIGESLLDFIPANGGIPETVQTRLHESVLQSLAADTGGEYLAAQQTPPPLGEFYATRVASRPSRLYQGDPLPQPRERFAWFLAPALLLFTLHGFRGR